MAHRVYTPTWDGDMSLKDKRLGLMTGTFTGVSVVPLMVSPDNVSATYSTDIFPDSDDHLRRAKVILWPRNGEVCKPIPHPTKDGIKFPHGTFLDTTTCPLQAIHPLCVRQYLEVRGLHLRQKEEHRTLLRLFKRASRKQIKPFTLQVVTNQNEHNHTCPHITHTHHIFNALGMG